jgi:bla regulator protein BlaR1
MSRLRKIFLCFAMSFVAVQGAHAQTFDIISIRPQTPGAGGFFVRPPVNGRFTATGATAKLLLMLAYDVPEAQLAGGPAWLGTAKWNVEARTDDGAQHSIEDTKRMLQNLLVTRFGLQFHRERVQRPIYALMVGKDGPKLTVSQRERTNVRVTGRSLDIQRGNIAVMIQVLASALGRPVIDRTGLGGFYDFRLEWDDAPIPDGGAFRSDAPPAATSDHGSIFTALQEQLGLRLESLQGPVDVITIDRIETPSEN